MYQCEVLPKSWSKRCRLKQPPKKVIDFELLGFIKTHNQRCTLQASFDDGEMVMLGARVYVNKIHTIAEDSSLSFIETIGCVQGTNVNGVSVVFR